MIRPKAELLILQLQWPITAKAIAKRNTVNKEILINKQSFTYI